MKDDTDLLLSGGVFDPKECLSSEELTKELTASLGCSQCRECGEKIFHKMGCGSKYLPLLPSERQSFQNKIRELQEQLQLNTTVTLHGVTRAINTCEFLSKEQKEDLLELIWKD